MADYTIKSASVVNLNVTFKTHNFNTLLGINITHYKSLNTNHLYEDQLNP